MHTERLEQVPGQDQEFIFTHPRNDASGKAKGSIFALRVSYESYLVPQSLQSSRKEGRAGCGAAEGPFHGGMVRQDGNLGSTSEDRRESELI